MSSEFGNEFGNVSSTFFFYFCSVSVVAHLLYTHLLGLDMVIKRESSANP